MRQMAQIDSNGIVVNVIVAGEDWNVEGFVEYTDDKPAGIGYTYDPVRDAFIPPRPTPDAVLDEETCQWIMPTESIGADSVGAESL
jgi:hypothetical protein